MTDQYSSFERQQPNETVAPALELRTSRDERRRRSLFSYLYGGIRPRRRHFRRDGDRHVVDLDWHESRILYLTLGILLLSATDAVLTLNLLTFGATEVNGFMATLIERDLYLFAWTKMLLTGLGAVVLAVYGHRKVCSLVKGTHLLYAFLGVYTLLVLYEAVLLSSASSGSAFF